MAQNIYTGFHGVEEKVRRYSVSKPEGIVEFEATYTADGMRDVHHEIGGFRKIDGEWLYSEGMMRPTTVVREGRKIGRNEPCPCGSGKKYKQCCGKN